MRESELKNSSKTLKSLKTGIWYRYLAITSLDFNIFKNGFRIWIPHDISKKIMYHIYFLQDTTQENTPNFQIINQIKVYSIHVIIWNRTWPSLNGGSLEIIIVYLTSLKNRHVFGHFIKWVKIRQGKPLLHVEQ